MTAYQETILSIKGTILKQSKKKAKPQYKNRGHLSKSKVSKEAACTYRVFIKGLAPGKLISCEDDFARLFRPSCRKFSFKKIQLKNVCSPVKTSCSPAENV